MARSEKPDRTNTSVKAKFAGVDALLKGLTPVEHCGADIYFVNEETLRAFIRMRSDIEATIEDEKKRRFALYPYVNILNDIPIAKHTLTKKRPYSLVIDAEKIYEKLDTKFIVWRNSVLKQARDTISEHDDISEELQKKINREAELEIERGEALKELLLSKYDTAKKKFVGLDVRASDFLRSEIKGYINMTDINNKASQGYLRIEVPNIVCEVEEDVLLHRSNYIIQAFHDEAKHAFSNIYIRNTQKEES